MLFSVIIPCHNRSESLHRALKSVFAQTYTKFEVIIVDDGSTDDTAQLIQNCFPQCVYIYQANKGVSAARNTGIAQAKGEWIAFLDSDDEWLPAKLQIQIQAATNYPEHKIIHTDEIWIRNGKRVNPMRKHQKYGGWIFEKCLPLCAISPSSVMIQRQVFHRVGLFDESLPACEDYDLWLRVCSLYPVHFIEEALIIKYGGHQDQLSTKYWGMDRFRIKALSHIIQSGSLNQQDMTAARSMLIKKLQIYILGAKKRQKYSEIEHYEKLLLCHQQT